MPTFMKGDMKAHYIGELNSNLTKLRSNLDTVPSQMAKKVEKPAGIEGDDNPITKVSKSDIVLEFKIEVNTICDEQLQGLVVVGGGAGGS